MRGFQRKEFVIYLLAAVGALALLITFTPLVRLAVSASVPEWDDENGEVLIVLGGSMLVSGTGPQATLGYDTYLRCVTASWILRSRHFHYIVVTGRDGLAEAMARYLVQNGADVRSVLLERSAGSTYENAIFTRRILQRQYLGKPLPPVTVLTSDYHAGRALRTFRHCGFRAGALPIPDVIKRSNEPAFRLLGAQYLMSEWIKDAFYLLAGRA